MIRNRYNYPIPPIRDIKGKETQTRNNWTLMETSLAESQTDSYFPTKWTNGYPKQKDVSDTHFQRRTITKIKPLKQNSVLIILPHYENTPIQIYRKISSPKTENFQIKISDSFRVSAQNIDCWYSLEPPRRGGSNEYPQSMF